MSEARNFAVGGTEVPPRALQTSECSELLNPTRTSCVILVQRQPGKLVWSGACRECEHLEKCATVSYNVIRGRNIVDTQSKSRPDKASVYCPQYMVREEQRMSMDNGTDFSVIIAS